MSVLSPLYRRRRLLFSVPHSFIIFPIDWPTFEKATKQSTTVPYTEDQEKRRRREWNAL
jgi:hypothetical protein